MENERQSEPGKKFDAGKPRYDLVPLDSLEAVAMVLAYGAQKYGERNWEKGMSWSRPFAACLRHLFAWFIGRDIDPESGQPHLAHAACNLFFLLAFANRKTGTDDRPKMTK